MPIETIAFRYPDDMDLNAALAYIGQHGFVHCGCDTKSLVHIEAASSTNMFKEHSILYDFIELLWDIEDRGYNNTIEKMYLYDVVTAIPETRQAVLQKMLTEDGRDLETTFSATTTKFLKKWHIA